MDSRVPPTALSDVTATALKHRKTTSYKFKHVQLLRHVFSRVIDVWKGTAFNHGIIPANTVSSQWLQGVGEQLSASSKDLHPEQCTTTYKVVWLLVGKWRNKNEEKESSVFIVWRHKKFSSFSYVKIQKLAKRPVKTQSVTNSENIIQTVALEAVERWWKIFLMT